MLRRKMLMGLVFLYLLALPLSHSASTTTFRHKNHGIIGRLVRREANLTQEIIKNAVVGVDEVELDTDEAPGSGGGRRDREEQTALKALDKLLKKYDRRSTPTNDQDVPTKVSCQLFVASLSSINTENMDYVTDTYLRQKWSDKRLSHADIRSPLDLADPLLVKAIWKPEVYFPNAKEANFQFVTVPNVLIRIHPGGEILYILRLRLKFSCMMELSRYPLDTQVCAMQISSFSKTTKELLLEWDNPLDGSAVSVARDLKMPQFEMQKISTNRCHEENHMGNYSCLVAEFHLHRSIGFHLIQSYLPSILIVAISWVSFWMDVDCVPARVTLGVITLLTVSSQVSGTSVPQTSYVKAIDVWMGVCTAFVFAALVEFTFVNYLWRQNDMEHGDLVYIEARNNMTSDQGDMEMRLFDDEKLDVEQGTNGCSKKAGNDNEANRHEHESDILQTSSGERCQSDNKKPIGATIRTRKHNKKLRAMKIDEVCRYLFPIGFAIFNVCYWIYYREEPVAE